MRKIIWLILLNFGLLYGGNEMLLDSANAYNLVNRTNKINQSIITNSSAIIVFPTFVKAGFILGATIGRGVMLVRDDMPQEYIDDNISAHQNSIWSAVPVRLSGATIGLQAGYENNFIVMYVMNKAVIKDIYDNKLTLSASVSVSFMDYGVNSEAISDMGLSDIYAYTNNRGFFVGAELGGSVITVDDKIKFDTASYGHEQLMQAISVIR
ncbi:lipid-binding SYLF domain-containing protein [Campylobacter sp.]|uniref:lipid-binding SYLF domain-containing protein n=1 Tax=Campylobacter sp. TaxID=205 RepID=UPI00259CFB03|nr:lipid-binding SYLF domain-containing protein [Campylobacter sp.]MBQ8820641.1 lipid-binding SYLF domain-containing protein [Campylobacter sp.]